MYRTTRPPPSAPITDERSITVPQSHSHRDRITNDHCCQYLVETCNVGARSAGGTGPRIKRVLVWTEVCRASRYDRQGRGTGTDGCGAPRIRPYGRFRSQPDRLRLRPASDDSTLQRSARDAALIGEQDPDCLRSASVSHTLQTIGRGARLSGVI